MTALQRSVQGRPIIIRRLFVVADDAIPHPIQEVARVAFDLSRPVWKTTHGLVLVSTGNDFYPRVTLESWTKPIAEPPPDQTWEDLGRFDVSVPVGRLWIEHADGPKVGEPLLLPPETTAAAYSGGRATPCPTRTIWTMKHRSRPWKNG